MNSCLKQPTRNLLTRAGLITANICLWLVLLEVAVRVAGISMPHLDRLDREVGWALRPRAEGLVADENKLGVYVRINSDGLTDREHSIAKEPAGLRIAVLGDSFAEAIEVLSKRHFGRCWNASL